MQNQIVEGFVAIFTAIIGVAIVAIILSRQSNTAGVLQAWGASFSNALGVAVSPVSGTQVSGVVGLGGGGLGGLGTLGGFGGTSYGSGLY